MNAFNTNQNQSVEVTEFRILVLIANHLDMPAYKRAYGEVNEFSN